jgi:hypothetical protein
MALKKYQALKEKVSSLKKENFIHLRVDFDDGFFFFFFFLTNKDTTCLAKACKNIYMCVCLYTIKERELVHTLFRGHGSFPHGLHSSCRLPISQDGVSGDEDARVGEILRLALCMEHLQPFRIRLKKK